MTKKHLIIGTSAAGISAANTLRNVDAEAEIICISQEAELPYNKCLLADYMLGLKNQEDVITLTPQKAQQKRIELLLNSQVMAIQPATKSVELSDGQRISYDTLLIATGASPYKPPIAGIQAQGVHTFYTLQDSNTLLHQLTLQQRNIIVIGAGLSGLECADALRSRGAQVTIIEKADQLLPRHVTKQGSCIIERAVDAHGVSLHLNAQVMEIMQQNNQVIGVKLNNGICLPADMVVVAVGVRPNSWLALRAGITLHNEGILVNDYMQTSCADIYAAGDVIMVNDMATGKLVNSCTWPDASLQGLVAAYNMAGKSKKYPGATLVTSSSFFGIKFSSCGLLQLTESIQRISKDGHQFYHDFFLDQGVLKGFSLVGTIDQASFYKKMVLTQEQVGAERLLQGF